MTESVALPLWVVVAVGLFALWALYEHVLIPALRWMLTHPANRVLDDVSTRLRIAIRPFQRTRRQALIHRLLTDPKVQQAAEQFSRDRRAPLPVALEIVETYAREIVPAFNAYLYFRLGYWLGRRIARLLYRVRIGYVDSAGLERIDPNATVVCVMNHRSNMDYVLAGFLAADQAALSYAVGEWARIWPLSALIRAMGAYFVRRNSRDELYRRVLERYIAMATEAGVPQAVFPEGGLTRDGRMREPKLGVLDRPDIEFPAVIVTVTYPGVAPTQMESEITRKVEDAVATIAGIEQMTSTVDEGASTTSIEFRFGTDLSAALDDVRDAMTRIRPDLPADANEPIVSRVTTAGGAVDLLRHQGGKYADSRRCSRLACL